MPPGTEIPLPVVAMSAVRSPGHATAAEPLSVVVPIVYDIEQNQTSIVQKGEMSPVGSIANQIISNLMQSGALNTGKVVKRLTG